MHYNQKVEVKRKMVMYILTQMEMSEWSLTVGIPLYDLLKAF